MKYEPFGNEYCDNISDDVMGSEFVPGDDFSGLGFGKATSLAGVEMDADEAEPCVDWPFCR